MKNYTAIIIAMFIGIAFALLTACDHNRNDPEDYEIAITKYKDMAPDVKKYSDGHDYVILGDGDEDGIYSCMIYGADQAVFDAYSEALLDGYFPDVEYNVDGTLITFTEDHSTFAYLYLYTDSREPDGSYLTLTIRAEEGSNNG